MSQLQENVLRHLMTKFPILFKPHISRYLEERRHVLKSRIQEFNSDADCPSDPSVATVLRTAGQFVMDDDG